MKSICKTKGGRKKKYLPWLTNSGGLLVLPELLFGSETWFKVLIDDILLWDGNALLSISNVLVLQKSSVILCLFTRLPWILSPLDGSSTEIISGGFIQHPRQPLLCYKLGLEPKKWLVHTYIHIYIILVTNIRNSLINCKIFSDL